MNASNIKKGTIVMLKDDISFDLGKNVQIPKERPYIVISNNTNNVKAPIVNIAAISSQLGKANYKFHVFLDKNKYSLKRNSIILTEQILTINKDKIKEIKATLELDDLKKLNKAMKIQLHC